MAAAGVYNALIAQLAEGPRAQALLDHMVDYDDCVTEGSCGPSVWIGMVGRDEIWPVRRVSRRDLAEQRLASGASDEGRKRAEDILEYSWPRPLTDEDGRERHSTVATLDRYRLPRTAALIGLLVLLATGFLSAPWMVRRALASRALPPGPRQGLVQIGRSLDMLYPPDMELPWRLFASAPSGDRLAGLRREHVLGSVACAGATLCAGFWMATALLATYATLPRWAWHSLQVTSWLAVGVLAIVAGSSAAAATPLRTAFAAPPRVRHRPGPRDPRGLRRLGAQPEADGRALDAQRPSLPHVVEPRLPDGPGVLPRFSDHGLGRVAPAADTAADSHLGAGSTITDLSGGGRCPPVAWRWCTELNDP